MPSTTCTYVHAQHIQVQPNLVTPSYIGPDPIKCIVRAAWACGRGTRLNSSAHWKAFDLSCLHRNAWAATTTIDQHRHITTTQSIPRPITPPAICTNIVVKADKVYFGSTPSFNTTTSLKTRMWSPVFIDQGLTVPYGLSIGCKFSYNSWCIDGDYIRRPKTET